jgi:probable F420-dependent oxidoreductase
MGLKFSIQLPVDRVDQISEFGTAEAVSELASSIEAAGFDACFVTEHPFPTDRWLASGGHHAFDPFVALSVAAAATRTLKLHTNILVIPYRNPFLVAKAIASLDVVSNGRVIVGAGAGYLRGEFTALGARVEDRNDRFDEAIVAMRAAWSGESVEMSGPGFEVEGNTMRPRPVQQPGPPIWIGGNSPRAIRRAVDFGEGWSPFPLPAAGAGRTRTTTLESIDDLKIGIARLRDYAASQNREAPIEINFVPFGLPMNVRSLPGAEVLHEQFEALEAAGVSWVSIGMPTPNRSAFIDSMMQFAETFLASPDPLRPKNG